MIIVEEKSEKRTIFFELTNEINKEVPKIYEKSL
jgi:hypothetical protein